jgi:acyl carrier protein
MAAMQPQSAIISKRNLKSESISNMNSVLPRIQKAFNAAFDVDPKLITVETAPGDIPAWDSMGHVTLASSLEREFSLSFDVDELMEMENVREIVRIVSTKLAEK